MPLVFFVQFAVVLITVLIQFLVAEHLLGLTLVWCRQFLPSVRCDIAQKGLCILLTSNGLNNLLFLFLRSFRVVLAYLCIHLFCYFKAARRQLRPPRLSLINQFVKMLLDEPALGLWLLFFYSQCFRHILHLLIQKKLQTWPLLIFLFLFVLVKEVSLGEVVLHFLRVKEGFLIYSKLSLLILLFYLVSN